MPAAIFELVDKFGVFMTNTVKPLLINDKDKTEPAIPCPTIIKSMVLFFFGWIMVTIFYATISARKIKKNSRAVNHLNLIVVAK